MNLSIIEERMKHDILAAIGKYEQQYHVSATITCGVIATVMCELQAAKMQEMIMGGENGRKEDNSENKNRTSKDQGRCD